MLALLGAYRDILFQRRGPEDLPDSGFLLRLTIALNASVSMVAVAIMGLSLARGALLYIVAAVLLIVLVGIALSALNLGSRLTQTLTAIFGGDVILTVFQWPIALWGRTLHDAAAAGGTPQISLPLLFAELVLIVWWFTLISFVIHRATGRPRLLGAAIAGVHFLLRYSLLIMAFPVPE